MKCRHCGRSITSREGLGGVLWQDDSPFAGAVCLKAHALLHEPSTPPSSTPERVPALLLCETPDHCTCGAPATTPRGMHHDDCGVRTPPGSSKSEAAK